MNEDDFIALGMAGHDATSRAVTSSVQRFHVQRFDIDAFDAIGVEHGSGRIGPTVMDDPTTVGSPNADIGQDMSVGSKGYLPCLEASHGSINL